MKVCAIGTVHAGGKVIAPGGYFDVDEAEAERLVGLGAAEVVMEPAGSRARKGDGKKALEVSE